MTTVDYLLAAGTLVCFLAFVYLLIGGLVKAAAKGDRDNSERALSLTPAPRSPQPSGEEPVAPGVDPSPSAPGERAVGHTAEIHTPGCIAGDIDSECPCETRAVDWHLWDVSRDLAGVEWIAPKAGKRV